MADESVRWLKGLGKQSSIKNRWPHGQGKPGEPSKPPSGIRRSSSSDSQDGSSSERSQYNTRSRSEISGRVGAGSKTVVPAQVETTQSITRPRTSPQVQQIPQPTSLQVTRKPPTETQPSTTRPFIGGKQPTTQLSFHTTSTYTQPSKLKPVTLKSKSHSSEGHQTSEGVSAHPTNSTPSMPPHLVYTVQGHPPSTTAAATPESLALVSVSEVAGQEREENWLVVSQGDVPSHIEGVQIPPQQQVSEARAESGTDLQAAKKIQEYRKQREAARMEVKVLQGQLAQSKTEVEQGGNKVARCERRIHELEAEVSGMNAKYEARIKQLRQEFESILAQKDERSREAVAQAQSFGGDPSESAQRQLEASYQAKIQQKEREFRENEREFQRKQRHYLAQIAQLEEGRDEAKTREGELRGEMERMKMEYQSQLHKLCGSMPDSSLDEDSRCPSNPIVCQPSSTDVESKVVTRGVEHTSVELQHFQTILSRKQIDINPAELASLGAQERRTVQRKVQQLQNEVDIRDLEIETLSDQLLLKEKRITALRRTIEETRKTTEKGLRHQSEDSYLDQLIELTGQLSAFKASDRVQKNELAKLRVKVKEAEEVTGHLDGAVERMSDLETENQTLKQQVAKLQEHAIGEAAAQQSGGEITYQSYNRQVMAELIRLQPLEAEVQHLRKELTEAQEFRAAAIKFESQVVNLITEVSEKEKQVSDLQSEKSQLEARIGALASRDVDGEIARMREQLFAKEEELTRLESERVGITGGQRDAGYAEDATRMKLETENLTLKQQGEKLRMEQERDSYKMEVEQLRGDLEVTHNETAKEERKQKGETVGLRLKLAAQKSEQDQLHHQLEQTEATVRQLETDLNLSQATMRQDAAKVSSEQGQRMALTVAKLDEVVKERNQLEQKTIVLQAQFENTNQELARSRVEVTKLTTEVEQLCNEKAMLQGEVEAHKFTAQTFQEDFEQECKDREKAFSQVAEIEERYQHQLQSMVTQLNHTSQDLQKHKETLATMETLLHSQIEALSDRLIKKDQQVAAIAAENDRLQEEVLSKMQQAQTFQEDFEQERKDREKAHSQVVEIEERYQHQLQSMVTQLNLTAQDLQKHKETLATTETLLHAQIEQLSDRLTEKDQQVAAIAAENDHLQEEVLSKTQQVSQLMTEKQALQQAAQAEQLQLMQLMQKKDSEKDQLQQQVSALSGQIQRYAQQPQSQRSHEGNFWEVPRNEITFNMQKFLGTGAWGFVVEGKFRGQQVAVKCLHDLIRQPEVIETIRKEICIMAQIRHPNLVMLIAAVIDAENDPLIVTELLDISLRKAYEKCLLQGSSKLSIFRDVASALNYLHLHQRGEIIHRDVSSANVLLEAKPNHQWKAKLSDFGSAKLAIEAKTTGPGAPAYTAPEVRKEMGIRQTAKLDVYSYGIVLCEVIVGQFPMEGSLPSMMQVVGSRWPFMHALVTSCIQEHPDNRPTMSYVLGEIDKLRPQK